MPGGILWDDDYPRLCESVLRTCERFPQTHLNFVEIGVFHGLTSRDLIAEILGRTTDFTYTGVDPGPCPDNMPPQYIHVQEISHLAIDKINKHINWCLVDGCHCQMCCIRDANLYGERLVPSGELCFHDASPRMQGRDPQNYQSMEGHHDSEIARRGGIQVRKALDSGLIPGLKLVVPAPDQTFGGVEVFEKI